MFEDILDSFAQVCVDLAWRLAAALLVFLIGNFVIRFLIKILKRHKNSPNMDPLVHSFMCSGIKVGSYIALMVAVVAILGIQTASIIAVIAAAGAAVALGVQGSLSHLAGGIMLLIFRPFEIGDSIEVLNYAGEVSELGLFYTELVTGDNLVCRIPNGTLLSSTILNHSVKDTRCIELSYDLAIGADMGAVKNLVRGVVEREGGVLSDPAMFLRITELSSGAAKLTLRVWTKSEEVGIIRINLTEKLYNAFVQNHVPLARPAVDVRMERNG